MKDKYYVAHLKTDSGDDYVYLFDYKPTRKEVQKRLWEAEGKIEQLKWYEEYTFVEIFQTEVISK